MYFVTISRDLAFTIPEVFKNFVKKGDEFLVFSEGDTIILKKIKRPVFNRRRIQVKNKTKKTALN